MKLNSLSKQVWNQGLPGKSGDFLQSWGWGKLKEKLGEKVFRFSEENKKEGLFRAQVIKKKLWGDKSYFYCPRGPLGLEEGGRSFKYFEDFIELLAKLAKKEDSCFLRLEPPFESKDPHFEPPSFLEEYNFLKAPRAHQPVDTLVKDISDSSEDILAGFSSKTRYNIRLAKRKGVNIRELKAEPEFEQFYQLLKDLSREKEFGILKKGHYRKLFQFSREEGDKNEFQVVFLGGFYEGSLIGALVGAYFKKRGYYLHGANDYEKRNLMGSYLLQWALINKFKKLGAQSYDLWGVIREEKFSSPEAYRSDDWYGITRFKEKFGGEKLSYPGGYDYSFQDYFYKAYRTFRKIKHSLKGN